MDLLFWPLCLLSCARLFNKLVVVTREAMKFRKTGATDGFRPYDSDVLFPLAWLLLGVIGSLGGGPWYCTFSVIGLLLLGGEFLFWGYLIVFARLIAGKPQDKTE